MRTALKCSVSQQGNLEMSAQTRLKVNTKHT